MKYVSHALVRLTYSTDVFANSVRRSLEDVYLLHASVLGVCYNDWFACNFY